MSEHKEPIPSMIYNASVGGHVTNSQQIIDENENKEQSQINAEVKQILGQGGSVDIRIANAVNEEKTRAKAVEEELDGRVDTIEEAVGTGGSVDSRISSAVAIETTRATEAEEQLRTLYNSLQQSQPIPVTSLPTTGEPGKIYRLAGTTSYADYMYNSSDLTTPIKMAQYDNAIDDEPNAESNNLVKSSGIYNEKISCNRKIVQIGYNFFNNVEENKYLTASGTVGNVTDGLVTQFIPVIEGQKWLYHGGFHNNDELFLVWGYSDEKGSNATHLVDSVEEVETEITIPNGVNFIRAWSYKNKSQKLYLISSELDIIKKEISSLSVNAFITKTTNGFLNNTGKLSLNSLFVCTDYIPVKYGDDIFYKGGWGQNDGYYMVWGYSDNMGNNPIGLIPSLAYVETRITIPNNVNYIRAFSVIERDKYLYNLQDLIDKLSLIEGTKEIVTQQITATRNASDFNSIREIMQNINDASYYKRYEIIIPKGRWFECDIQGKEYVTLIGESMNETIIYCDGSSDKTTPNDYTYSDYQNVSLSTIPRQYKHCIFSKENTHIKNLTIEAKECKYNVHLDNNGYTEAVFENCIFDALTNINYCVGTGIRGGQSIVIKSSIFKKEYSSYLARVGIFAHNWNNQSSPAYLTITDCLFSNCDIITIDELGSGQDDLFVIKNCHTSFAGRLMLEVDHKGNGNTYYINNGVEESNPQNVPYSIKLNLLGTNVSSVISKIFGGTQRINSRPDFYKYIVSDNYKIIDNNNYSIGNILNGFNDEKGFISNNNYPIFGIVEYVSNGLCYLSYKEIVLPVSVFAEMPTVNNLVYNVNGNVSLTENGEPIGIIEIITEEKVVIKRLWNN